MHHLIQTLVATPGLLGFAFMLLRLRAALAHKGEWNVQVKLEPRDLWVGLYWTSTDTAVHFYFCAIPGVVTHLWRTHIGVVPVAYTVPRDTPAPGAQCPCKGCGEQYRTCPECKAVEGLHVKGCSKGPPSCIGCEIPGEHHYSWCPKGLGSSPVCRQCGGAHSGPCPMEPTGDDTERGD